MSAAVTGITAVLRNVLAQGIAGNGKTIAFGILLLVWCALVVLDILSRYGVFGPNNKSPPPEYINEIANLLRNITLYTE
jgi:hypothetical protein